MKIDSQTQAVLYEFATRVLRNEADKDYITARIAHRFEFDQQFLWSAEQAVEKYLKAILLYNATPAKRIGHNLRRALDKIRSIDDFDCRFPPYVTDFVEYLDDCWNWTEQFGSFDGTVITWETLKNPMAVIWKRFWRRSSLCTVPVLEELFLRESL